MKIYKRLSRLILPVAFSMLTTICVSAQINNEPPSRSITSRDFQTKRPAVIRGGNKKTSPKKTVTPVSNNKRRKSIAVITNPGRRYKFIKRTMIPKTAVSESVDLVGKVKKNNPVKPSEEAGRQDEELGVTFWRLRPLKKEEEEDAPTFEVNTGDGREKWTAERVRSTTKFKMGDRVRFTIEPLRSGYLYVINREVYEDGSTGEAEVIYPEMNNRSRQDNRVNAGRLVEIPSISEDLPYFIITPKDGEYFSEEIIVLISPTKLTGFTVSAKTQSLRREVLQNWLNSWNSVTDIYDASDGEGVAYTRTEEESVRTRSLTQEEPLPQTIYKVTMRETLPVFVVVKMQVSQRK